MDFDRKRDEPSLFGPVLSTLRQLFGDDEQAVQPAPQPAQIAAPATPADPTALLPWMDDVKSFGPQGESTGSEHRAQPKRVAEVELGKPGGPRYDPRFVPMAHGSIPETAAPSTLRLPEGIVTGLDQAWARSQQANHDERGGNIVKTWRSGSYEVRHGGGDADNDEWMPDRSDTRAGQEFIGTYHTHDSTADNPAFDSVTFSEWDMANMADRDDRMKFVRSGKQTYMLARTKEFDALAKQHDGDPEKELAFKKQMMDTYNKVYEATLKGDKQRHAEACEAATRATAAQYHLLYYQGQGSRLNRVGQQAK